jgi:hypothetical protein
VSLKWVHGDAVHPVRRDGGVVTPHDEPSMSGCRVGAQHLRPIEDHRDWLLSAGVRSEKDEPAVRGDIVRWRLTASSMGRLE